MGLKSYRELEVWQRAMDLVVNVYKMSGELPGDERYGLKSQMQRAAVSIPANIAEGYARTHAGEYLQHLSISRGSLAELETHIAVAARLGFVTRPQARLPWDEAQVVGRMLTSLVGALQKRQHSLTQTPDPKPQTQQANAGANPNNRDDKPRKHPHKRNTK